MIPAIKTLYLRLVDTFAANKYDSPIPENWDMQADEYAYLEQIRTIEDLSNFTDDGTGRMNALAYDAALAMGLSNWDAQSLANDH